MQVKRSVFYLGLMLATILVIVIRIYLRVFFLHQRLESFSIHSTVVAIGMLASITIAIFLLQQKPVKRGTRVFMPATGFLGMGILEGFHGISLPGHGFVLLHAAASLVGGIFFALAWLPEPDRYSSTRKQLPWIVVAGAVLFGIYTLLFRETLPAMVQNGEFTVTAIFINLFAGILFIASSLYFLLDFHRSGNLDAYLLCCLSLLFGLSGLMFKYSAVWTEEWWFWHTLSLMAYLLTLWFVIHKHQQTVSGFINTVAEREQVARELKESEKKYHTMIEHSNDLTWTLDKEGNFTYFNKMAADVSGYKLTDWIGKSFAPLIPPDELPRINEIFFKTMSGISQQYEVSVLKEDKSIFVLSVNTAPLFEAGEVIGTVSFGRDITERKKMQDQLFQSQHDWEDAFNTITDIITVQDKDFNIIRANKAAEKILGLPSLESTKAKCYTYYHGAERPLEWCPNCKCLETGEPAVLEIFEPHLNRFIELRAIPRFDINNQVTGLIHVARDITERKKAEEEIEQSYDIQSVINSLIYLSLQDVSLKEILKNALDLILAIPWLISESRGSIFLVEDDPEVLVMKAQNRLAKPIQKACEKVPFGRCLCGRAALTQEIQFADHIDERHDITYEGITPHGQYSVPILFADKTLGVVNVYVKEGHAHSKREEELLISIANALAGIIVRKRAEEAIKIEAEISKSLLQIVETLNTSLDEKDLIRNVIFLTPQYMKFDRLSIFFYDEELKGFTFSGGYGLSPVEEGILLTRTFKGGDFPAIDKALKGELVIIANARESNLISKEMVEIFNIGSAVLVPVSFRGKVAGGIYGDYKTVKSIEQKEILLLKGLADGIGIALQNSRLYKESIERMIDLSNKIETIKTMSQLDREILSTLDKATILKTATALLSKIIPCERAAVLFREGATYRVISEWGIGNFHDNLYNIENSHFRIIEMMRSSLFIPDIAEDAANCLYHKEQSAIGIKSSLIIPLISKNEIVGILDIGSAYQGKLTSAHLSTAENIASQITVALENARLYEDLEHLLINTITSLASAIDAKSAWTKGHSERVTKFAVEIARGIGLKDKEIEHIRLCGLLHDIGKIGVYDKVLDKEGKLTDEEFEHVKTHAAKGAEILRPIKQLQNVILGVLHHHERYDGRGYPEGLRGEDIPLCARILCVADSFDSMTADRPYRQSPGKEYAISELKRCSGTQFDPKIVETFLKVLEKDQ